MGLLSQCNKFWKKVSPKTFSLELKLRASEFLPLTSDSGAICKEQSGNRLHARIVSPRFLLDLPDVSTGCLPFHLPESLHFKNLDLCGNSLAVQWLGLCAGTAEGRGVQSLVGELRSRQPGRNKTRIWSSEGEPNCFSSTRCSNYQEGMKDH